MLPLKIFSFLINPYNKIKLDQQTTEPENEGNCQRNMSFVKLEFCRF